MATASEPDAKTKTLMTAEQFMEMEGEGCHELVQGEVIEVPAGGFQHAIVCANIVAALQAYGKHTGYGYALCNDFAVRTERGPDTVRGADVAFYTNARLPLSPTVPRLPSVAPDLVVEVYSPPLRPSEIIRKVNEYLDAGVLVVWVVNAERRTVAIYRPDDPIPAVLSENDVLENLPELPGFRCPVAEFFA
jgi:Uma2 family endonuclease